MRLRGGVMEDDRRQTTDDRLIAENGLYILIGGVGYRWMGDASFGLVASDEMARLDWPPGVEIADLGYGALYVAQDLGSAEPPYDRLILLAGVERGRRPGTIDTYRWVPDPPDPEDLQARIREAGAGVIDLDHLLAIAHYFEALPDEVLVVEVEPIDTTSGDSLSPEAATLLPRVVEMVRQMALTPFVEQFRAAERSEPWSSPMP
jgi:hydrogenase maturation protease